MAARCDGGGRNSQSGYKCKLFHCYCLCFIIIFCFNNLLLYLFRESCCPICFGTGYRITLNRVNAAHQNNRISMRGDGMGFSEIDIVNVYYTNTDTGIKVGDIINDGEDFDVVKDVYYEHSDQQSVVYYRIETVPYKYDTNLLKKLMIKTLEKAGYDG